MDLGDFLSYRIGEMKSELTQAPGGGGRFPCEAVLLGKTYAKFSIDVGVGDRHARPARDAATSAFVLVEGLPRYGQGGGALDADYVEASPSSKSSGPLVHLACREWSTSRTAATSSGSGVRRAPLRAQGACVTRCN